MCKSNQLGYSLLESLIALAMVSTLSLGLMQLQLRLLVHSREIYHHRLASYAQISLAESLKSCLNNQACQSIEIERWKSYLQSITPQIKTHLIQENNTFFSTVYWNDEKIGTTLEFTHA